MFFSGIFVVLGYLDIFFLVRSRFFLVLLICFLIDLILFINFNSYFSYFYLKI